MGEKFASLIRHGEFVIITFDDNDDDDDDYEINMYI
jgi:hypothetical protein